MAIICTLANLYVLIIVARSVASFFPIRDGSPFVQIVDLLHKVTEPVLAPVRRVLPPMGGLDFSPLVVLIGVRVIASFLGC